MSDEMPCPNCGQWIAEDSDSCRWCGYSLAVSQEAPGQPEPGGSVVKPAGIQSLGRNVDQTHGGLHPLAPVIFAAVGIPVGIWTAVTLGPLLGVPLGILGGGIGVWVVERSRRLRQR